MAADSGDWIELQNRFYRFHDVYQMQWEAPELADQLVACAPFGGPIATARDPFKLVQVGMSASLSQLQTTISIHSAAGVLLSTINWGSSNAPLVHLGWTRDLTLVLIAQDGLIQQFTLQGHQKPGRISLDSVASAIVHACVIGGCGVLCTAADATLYVVPDLKEPEVIAFAPPELTQAPTCILGLNPVLPIPTATKPDTRTPAAAETQPSTSAAGSSFSDSQDPPLSILLATPSCVLAYNLNTGTCTELPLASVERMALSLSGKLLGCFTADGVLHVISCGDTLDVVAEYDTGLAEAPEQMVWCGEDAVLSRWDASGSLLLVGPEDSAPVPAYDGIPGVAMVLSAEVDGARVVTRRSCSFVQRVPDSVVATYGLGSTEPPALLFDAYEQFERRSVKADESIRLLGDSMASAIESCTEAACHEPTIASQQSLLKAAAYGRAYCKLQSRDLVKNACMVLRVLNAIRDPDAAGIPITFAQFQMLGPSEVVSLLLVYHRHLLALRISQYLGLPEERVLENWAAAKIAASAFLSDDDLYSVLIGKLRQERSVKVSYAAVADVAHQRGRIRLAAKLLEHELNEEKVVRLLVRMKQFAVALRKAEMCVDTDLLLLVIFQIQANLPEEALFQLLQDFPTARSLFISHYRHQDRGLLRRFLTAWNKPDLVAELWVEDCLMAAAAGAADSHERGGPWTPSVLKELEGAAALFDATREHVFQGGSLHEWVRMLKLEQKGEAGMSATTKALLQGKTVSECIYACFAGGGGQSDNVAAATTAARASGTGPLDQQQQMLLHQAANRIRSDLRVPERRFYWLKLRALAANQDWTALEKLSKERRPPIGFRPFVEACIEQGATEEAKKYIAKIPDPTEREGLYRRIGAPSAASGAQSGSTHGSSGDLLESIRSTLVGTPAASSASAILKGWGFS